MKRLNINTESQISRTYECPQCKKRRLYLPEDKDRDLSSTTCYTRYNGDEIELFTHVCSFCRQRNQAKYFVPSKADLKKIMEALKEEHSEGSLEDML